MNLVLRCSEEMQLRSLKLSPWGRYGAPHLLDQREFSFNFFFIETSKLPSRESTDVGSPCHKSIYEHTFPLSLTDMT